MDIGVLKEPIYNRVIISPNTAKSLIDNGNTIFFAKGAGTASNFSDDDYLKAGAIPLNNNIQVIKRSNILTSFSMPESSLLPIIKKKTLVFYVNSFFYQEQIMKLKKGGNSILAIEMIKDSKGKFIISEKIDEIKSNVGYNLINYLYNFQNNFSSGHLINNFNLNKRKSISIIGWNSLAKNMYDLYSTKNANIYIYDDLKNINDYDYPEEALLVSMDQIDNISRSDIIINTSRDYYEVNDLKIPDEVVKSLKLDSIFFDFNITYGAISSYLKPTNFNNLIYKKNNTIFSSIIDLTVCNAKDLSYVVSNFMFYYLNYLADNFGSNMGLINQAFILKDGLINKKIKFPDRKSDVHKSINNPFDLIEMDFKLNVNEDMDKINNILDDLSEY